MKRREFALTIVGGAFAPRTSAATTRPIRVIAQSGSQPPRSVVDARVFVLGEFGKELAFARTNDFGQATIPVFSETERPRYLLVEHDRYFISGLPWFEGLEEYFVLMTALAVR